MLGKRKTAETTPVSSMTDQTAWMAIGVLSPSTFAKHQDVDEEVKIEHLRRELLDRRKDLNEGLTRHGPDADDKLVERMLAQLAGACRVAHLTAPTAPLKIKNNHQGRALLLEHVDILIQALPAAAEDSERSVKRRKEVSQVCEKLCKQASAVNLQNCMRTGTPPHQNANTESMSILEQDQRKTVRKALYVGGVKALRDGGSVDGVKPDPSARGFVVSPGMAVKYTFSGEKTLSGRYNAGEAVCLVLGFGPHNHINGNHVLVRFAYTQEELRDSPLSQRPVVTGSVDDPKVVDLEDLFKPHPLAPDARPVVLLAGVGVVSPPLALLAQALLVRLPCRCH
jgi:hypothetical protein